MTREEFDYIDDRLKYLTVNSALIGSNITQMDCLISIANEYSEEYYKNKSRVCENCIHSSIDYSGTLYQCHLLRMSFNDDFGCNYFKSKVESK